MSIYRKVLLALLIALCVSSSSCQRFNNKFLINGPPVKDWDKQLSAQFAVVNTDTNQLQFVKDYNDRYSAQSAANWKTRIDIAEASVKFDRERFKKDFQDALSKALTAAAGKAANAKLEEELVKIMTAFFQVQGLTDKPTQDRLLIEVKSIIRAFQISGVVKESVEKSLAAVEADVELYLMSRKIQDDPELRDAYARILEMKLARNKIMGALIIIARAYHNNYDMTLYNKRATANVGFDIAQLAAMALSATAGSPRSAQSLAVFATAVAGAQESVDKRFFFEKTSGAVIATMNRQRHEVEARLITNMATRDALEWPLEMGLEEYTEFFTMGTIASALKELEGDASKKELIALTNLATLKTMSDANIKLLKEEQAARELKRQANLDKLEQFLRETLETTSASGGDTSAATAEKLKENIVPIGLPN